MVDELVLSMVIVVLVNGAFDAIVVAWIAAQRSPGAFDRWIRSDRAKPALHVIATHVREEVLPDLPKTESIAQIRAEISLNGSLIRKELATAIDQVRADMGRMHGELSAEMPPNIDGRVSEMERAVVQAIAKIDEAVGQIAQIDHGIAGAFTALDHKLGVVFGDQGQNEAAVRKLAEQVGEDLEGAMQGVASGLDTSNPMVRQFYVLATKPIDEKWAAKHPFAAMLVQGGKLWFGQNILPQFAEGASDVPQLSRASKGEKIL